MLSLVLCLLLTYFQVNVAQDGQFLNSTPAPVANNGLGDVIPPLLIDQSLSNSSPASPAQATVEGQPPGSFPPATGEGKPSTSQNFSTLQIPTQGVQPPAQTLNSSVGLFGGIPQQQVQIQGTLINDTFPAFVGNNNATEVTEGPVAEKAGMDAGNDGEAEDLADYVYKAVGKLINGDGKPDLKDCTVPPALNLSCPNIPADVMEYFNGDVTVSGVLSKLFDKKVLDELRSTCRPGQWCLPMNIRTNIEKSATNFLDVGPVCSDAMQECLRILFENRDCKEKELLFLSRTVALICGIGKYDEEVAEHSEISEMDHCFSATEQALFVLYADLTSPTQSKMPEVSNKCDEFTVDITRTYICTAAYCDAYPEDQLRDFYYWRNMTLNANATAKACEISVEQCPYYALESNDTQVMMKEAVTVEAEMEQIEKEIEEAFDEAFNGENVSPPKDYEGQAVIAGGSSQYPTASTTTTTSGPYVAEGYFPVTDKPVDDISADTDQWTGQDSNNVNTNTSYTSAENTMLFGLVTMTTIILLVLVGIAFMGLKKYRYSRMSNYRRGYSQLSEEERMLRNDYN